MIIYNNSENKQQAQLIHNRVSCPWNGLAYQLESGTRGGGGGGKERRTAKRI